MLNSHCSLGRPRGMVWGGRTQRYYELKEKDVLKFGFSSREYVLLHESSDTSEVDRKEDEDDEEEEEVSDS